MIKVDSTDFEQKVLPKLREYAKQISETNMEQWAQENHPWKNRTGEAQKGLIGYSAEAHVGDQDLLVMGVGHSVKYGPDLENKHDGKWGVLKITIEHFEPIVQEGLTRILKEVYERS